MADDMKRVGLIFKADGTVDFKKSLTSMNGALQENRNEFKLTQQTWDKNTKASQKLKDTQEYLAKQYDASTKKVSVLRAELDELENAETKDEKAIQKKKNALTSAEIAAGNYKKGLEEVNVKIKAGVADIQAYAKQLQAFADKTKKVGTSLSKNVTAPIMAVGTAAMVAWKKVDEAYDNIAAGTGATGKALSELQNVFDEVFGSMPVDADQASAAVADLNTRLGFTGDKLTTASKSFIEFAKVNKTDVASSVQLVTRAMGDASIDANDYQMVMDALTAASQQSGIAIDVLTSNLAKYGAPMRALGYTTQESIAIFAQWEKAGVNTEMAFSGMKKAISNWAKEGKDSRAEFKKTLEEIAACPDIASATTKAIEVFGAKAGPDLADAIQGGRFSIEEMAKSVENSGGIVSRTYNEMASPADKAKVSMNNMTLAGAALGEAIQITLAPILDGLSSALKGLTKWLKGLDGNTKQIVVVVGILVAALGPLLVVIGTVAGAISKIMTLYSSFAIISAGAEGAVAGLGAALGGLLLPITAVIAAIAAIVAAFVQLWNKNEEFKKAVTKAWNGIKEVIQEVWTKVLSPVFESIKKAFTRIMNEGIKPLWDKWVEFVGTITIKMTELWEKIKPIVLWFVDTFGPILSTIFEFVSSVFSSSVSTIMQTAGALLSNIGEVMGGIIDAIGGIIDFITGVFTLDWEKAWNGIVTVLGGIFDGIVGVVKVPINLVIGLVNGMIGAVESGINFVIHGLNKISFKVPDWVPGIGGKKFGANLKDVSLSRIEYLAKGGDLLEGTAIVGEAGMELLTQKGNRTTVSPLTRGGGADPVDIIDYKRLALTLAKELTHMKIYLDDYEVGHFVDKRILKAVK